MALKKNVYELFYFEGRMFLWKKVSYQELEQVVNLFYIL